MSWGILQRFTRRRFLRRLLRCRLLRRRLRRRPKALTKLTYLLARGWASMQVITAPQDQ